MKTGTGHHSAHSDELEFVGEGKGIREKEMKGNGKPFRAQRSKSFRKKWIRNQAIPFPFSLINPRFSREDEWQRLTPATDFQSGSDTIHFPFETHSNQSPFTETAKFPSDFPGFTDLALTEGGHRGYNSNRMIVTVQSSL